ncbi:MAG: class I SAM-dependent methyltransferase [Sphingomonadales bacterium]
MGWFESLYRGYSVTGDGSPLPWLTYPIIYFLDKRLTKEMTLFEYGSGNSTLWWADRVKEVIACEHNKEWLEFVKTKAPQNVELLYQELVYDGEYSKSCNNQDTLFDVIVIDGRDRVNCAKNAMSSLSKNGVIIWDNSDREYYSEGYDMLLKNNFRRLDFTGFVPVGILLSTTSVFYKENNVLGI